ncbi:MAG: glycosyltransferase family 2 protein [Kutzneria sp.]|nr:glycosyltransferase family 2 protein [Kutzneria sp.]MBV9846360.1 glycosyltransferase family 2 protein [Kutzneria sp.]
MPLLSVLTATLNDRSELLGAAGDSLAAQRLPAGWELEWIVEEDGERPCLAEVVGRFPFARHQGVGERIGVAAARNLALSRAAGSLVHVLDSDDLILPDGLAVAIEAFHAHPAIGWVAGQADDLLPDSTRVPVPLRLPPGLVRPGEISALITEYERSPVHPAGLTMRTAVVRALGGWTAVPRSEDNALLAAIAELTPGYITAQVTWLYRLHHGQTTRHPRWPVLDPLSWTVVHQRIEAVREVGLQLGAAAQPQGGR